MTKTKENIQLIREADIEVLYYKNGNVDGHSPVDEIYHINLSELSNKEFKRFSRLVNEFMNADMKSFYSSSGREIYSLRMGGIPLRSVGERHIHENIPPTEVAALIDAIQDYQASKKIKPTAKPSDDAPKPLLF